MPSIPNNEVALKLAATGTWIANTNIKLCMTWRCPLGMLKDHIVGERLITDYVLFLLNKNGKFE